MAASQEFVNSRLYPIEQSVNVLQESLDEIKNRQMSRDADLASAEKRFEEIAKTVEEMKQQIQRIVDGSEEAGSGMEGSRIQNVQGKAY